MTTKCYCSSGLRATDTDGQYAPNRLNDRLLFAVPKSQSPSSAHNSSSDTGQLTGTLSHLEGRLHEAVIDLLHGADIQFHRHSRLDIALVKNLPLALIFLPAADIPTFVGEGRVDLGITGSDQVAEHEANSPAAARPDQTATVEEVLDLDFGKCKLQVQVPDKGTIARPEELIGKTVVTSFTNIAWAYFAQLEARSSRTGHDRIAVGDVLTEAAEAAPAEAAPAEAAPAAPVEAAPVAHTRSTQIKTRIKYVSGSVEAACALGVADGIVDLVGTWALKYQHN